MMAHSKPTAWAAAADQDAYKSVLEFLTYALQKSPIVDLKNHKGKTALHLAAAGNNQYCMKSLFDMRAGHYQELRLIFYFPIGPFVICRWILFCCGVNMPLALIN